MFESWLPIGFVLPDGTCCGRLLHADANWQIVQTMGEGRALIVKKKLAEMWIAAGLLEEGAAQSFSFAGEAYRGATTSPSQVLAPVADCKSPKNKTEALAFATAFKATRTIDVESPLQDAIYFERFSRLLPSYGITARASDDEVIGYWLTGGARVSAKAFRRLRQMLTWLQPQQLREVVEAAGIDVSEFGFPLGETEKSRSRDDEQKFEENKDVSLSRGKEGLPEHAFRLPGRPVLEAFLNEHVIDIIRNADRYKAVGVGFPGAIVLHGPPGCGKTFAIEQLVDYLGWPSFQIDASSVASPYIHETSRKVADVFESAMRSAPSILVIDEMEAFLADRQAGGGSSHHRVEEVAEFLRRIPEAAKNSVLVVAMTNRLEMIDSAIMRRGRFDHIIKIDFATEPEVTALLDKLLSTLPKEGALDTSELAAKLTGRPLSDVAFVVREGARLSARAGKDRIGQEFLLTALHAAPSRTEDSAPRRIGFL